MKKLTRRQAKAECPEHFDGVGGIDPDEWAV